MQCFNKIISGDASTILVMNMSYEGYVRNPGPSTHTFKIRPAEIQWVSADESHVGRRYKSFITNGTMASVIPFDQVLSSQTTTDPEKYMILDHVINLTCQIIAHYLTENEAGALIPTSYAMIDDCWEFLDQVFTEKKMSRIQLIANMFRKSGFETNVKHLSGY